MVKSETLPRNSAKLNFSDGLVVMTPRDLDKFVMSAEKAIEACSKEVKKGERSERFSEHFVAPLYDWCLSNASRIRACYLAVPSDHVPVFVVTNSRRFDFDFAEKVAAIELQLAGTGWQVNVTQLPEADDESLATFLDPEKALQIYANS